MTGTDSGGGRQSDPEPQQTGLEWDGFQFVPSSAPPDESLPQIPSTPQSRFIPIAALGLGLAGLAFILLLAIEMGLPRDGVGQTAVAAFAALAVGLMVWCAVELRRIKALPERIRKERLADRLSQTIRFTSGELIRNRMGHLSLAQRARLIGLDSGWWLIVAACLGFVAALIARVGWWDPIKDLRALVVVAVGMYALWKASSALVDAVAGRVVSELTTLQPMLTPGNGWLSEKLLSWSGGWAYAYQADGRGLAFAVSRAAYEALTPGRRYRVYYTPVSKRLMSLEPAGY